VFVFLLVNECSSNLNLGTLPSLHTVFILLLILTLVEKRASIHPISPQTLRPEAKGDISPGSFKNVGQGALVLVHL
jgi:hypothetical protein